MRLDGLTISILLLLFALTAGCKQGNSGDNAEGNSQSTGQQQAVLGWFDPERKVNTYPRLNLPEGLDLRQAAFVKDRGGLAIAARVRDYRNRVTGSLDSQDLYWLDAGRQENTPVKLQSDEIPVTFLKVPDGSALVCAVATTNGARIRLQNAGIAGGEVRRFATLDEGLIPVGFGGPKTLTLAHLQETAERRGLLDMSIDWGQGAVIMDLSTEQASEADWFPLATNVNGLSCGVNVLLDPAIPSQARLEFLYTPGGKSPVAFFQTGYPSENLGNSWVPQIFASKGAAYMTMFDTTAGQDPPLYRFMEIDTKSGEQSLIADHLPAGLPVAVDGDTLFYSRIESDGEISSWQVWAAEVDGVNRRLLYRTPTAFYVSVEDAAGSDRVLVYRQFLEENTGILRGELLEISTQVLLEGEMALDEPASTSGNDIDDGFIPDGPSDLFSGSSSSSSSSSSSTPPPLSVPE